MIIRITDSNPQLMRTGEHAGMFAVYLQGHVFLTDAEMDTLLAGERQLQLSLAYPIHLRNVPDKAPNVFDAPTFRDWR